MQPTGGRYLILVGLSKPGAISIDVITENIFLKKKLLVKDQKEIEKDENDLACWNSGTLQ